MFIDKPAGEEIHTRPYRKDHGFGSTGETVVNLVQQMKVQPTVTITTLNDTEAHQITAVMDTGADVTIISRDKWSRRWSLCPAIDAVQGVGGGTTPMRSLQAIKMKLPEGQEITLCPYVMTLPGDLGGLIGRDILSQIGATLNVSTPF